MVCGQVYKGTCLYSQHTLDQILTTLKQRTGEIFGEKASITENALKGKLKVTSTSEEGHFEASVSVREVLDLKGLFCIEFQKAAGDILAFHEAFDRAEYELNEILVK